jgi:hypothetical protein
MLVIAALVACSDPSGPNRLDMSLVPDRDVYALGETIHTELVNHSRVEVEYGECELRLERLVGGEWALVGPPHLPCLDIGYVLSPGGRFVQTLRLDTSLEPGTYRLRREVNAAGSVDPHYIWSPEIRIEAASP